MRFVSKFPHLGLGAVIREQFVLALDGQRDKSRESLSVMFTQDYVSQDDLAFGLSTWREKEFTGRWLDEDHITLQPVAERIGVYDTDVEQERNGWDDETREKVEKWMLAKANHGLDFALFAEARIPVGAPWASYDATHHLQIPKVAVALGLVELTLAYERENKNRESIVEKLESLLVAGEELAPAEGELVVA